MVLSDGCFDDESARFVPKLMLILSRRTFNTTYRNSGEAHVFCSALPFQQATVNVCISNISRVTAGFVKTVVRTFPRKGKYNVVQLKHPFSCLYCDTLKTRLFFFLMMNKADTFPLKAGTYDCTIYALHSSCTVHPRHGDHCHKNMVIVSGAIF